MWSRNTTSPSTKNTFLHIILITLQSQQLKHPEKEIKKCGSNLETIIPELFASKKKKSDKVILPVHMA